MKVIRIRKSEVKVEGRDIPSITLSNGHEIVMTECWYKGVHQYNTIHNTYSVCFDGFFIIIKLRKPRSGNHHKFNTLQDEIKRAEKIANQIKNTYSIF